MNHSTTRRVAMAVVGLASSVAALTVTASPASAVDGWTEATVYTSNGGGSHAKAYVNFGGASYVAWNDIYLNDFCNSDGNGDGLTARVEFMVRYVGDSTFTRVGYREDTGGCTSAPYTGSAHWDSTRTINDAGIRACAGTSCSSISWRDNPS